MSLKVAINDKNYEAEKGEYILEVCRRNNVIVPTLCHHDGIPGIGACRLCVVEVDEGRGRQVVVSCVYPLNRDCGIFTESEKIREIRKTILSMLVTKAPEGDGLASLCQTYGVEDDSRFTHSKPEGKSPAEKRLSSSCVLCGLCAQACASIGSGAIASTGRGVGKKITTPYDEPSADCVGCASCALVCPTKAIEFSETETQRTIWGQKFNLIKCGVCGRPFATVQEYALALEKAEEDSLQVAKICEDCRKKKTADVFAAAFGERK
jgi:NADH dehydrogenase/NADH:ubiquinone oxidoreductase subunit G